MKQLLFSLLILLPLFTSLPAQAQIANVADAVNRKVEDGTTAVASIAWDKRTGNNDTSEFTGAGTLYYQRGADTTMLILRRDFGQEKGVESSDSSFEHLRHRHVLNDRWDIEEFIQEDRDPFRRVRDRFVAGAGPRVHLFTDKEQNLYLGVDPMYEKEEIEPGSVNDTEKLNYERARLSINLAYDLKIDDRLTLHNTGYYQPVVTDYKNRRIEDEAAVAMKIANHLDFKLSLVVAHDSRPPVGIKPLDQQYKNALEFSF